MSSIKKHTKLPVKTIETNDASVNLRADGILHVHFKENTEISLELQLSLRKIYDELLGDQPTGFIYSAEAGFSISKEARENFGNFPGKNPVSACGLVANNLAYRLVGNFLIKVYSPKIPIKLFDTVEEAAEWLHSKAYVHKP